MVDLVDDPPFPPPNPLSDHRRAGLVACCRVLGAASRPMCIAPRVTIWYELRTPSQTTTVYCKTSFSFHYSTGMAPMGDHQALCKDQFVCLFVSGATAPQWAIASSFTRFLDHTQRRTTVGRTPLDA